jgi:LPS sulfotransferase NodH
VNALISDPAANSWRAALQMLDEVGALAHLDAMASRQPLRILCRPEDEAFLRGRLPHARSADDGASVLLAQAEAPVLDCRPPGQDARRGEDGAPALRLGEDGLAIFLTGACAFPQKRPEPLSGRRYHLFSTPRSGSTYLSSLLASSGALGAPGEFLKGWLKPFLAASGLGLPALFDLLHGYSQTGNGVFGAKTIINDLFDLLPEHEDAFFAEARGKPCFMLVRGDKAAQALSNVRANSLSLYHVRENERETAAEKLRNFRAAIPDLFEKERWLLRQEADFIDLARRKGVRLRLLSYEALAQSRQAARIVVEQIAAELAVTEDLGEPTSDLVSLRALSGDDGLDAYRAFRRETILYSTRSEPNLGQVLGEGWGRVENWGANALQGATELEILAPKGRDAQAVGLILAFEGRRPPEGLAVDGVAVTVHHPDLRPFTWRLWAWPQASRESDGRQRLRLSFESGFVKIQEAVFYRTAPDWIAAASAKGRPVLQPA